MEENKEMKKLIKEYDFEKIEQYYDYIVESCINGQFEQVKELLIEMPEDNQRIFLNTYVANFYVDYYDQEILDKVAKLCIEKLTETYDEISSYIYEDILNNISFRK